MPFIKEFLPLAIEAFLTAVMVWVGIGVAFWIGSAGVALCRLLT